MNKEDLKFIGAVIGIICVIILVPTVTISFAIKLAKVIIWS